MTPRGPAPRDGHPGAYDDGYAPPGARHDQEAGRTGTYARRGGPAGAYDDRYAPRGGHPAPYDDRYDPRGGHPEPHATGPHGPRYGGPRPARGPRQHGGVPDSLLLGLLGFLLGLSVLIWTATGLAGLLSHGAWPDGVSYSGTPGALRHLVTEPHDLPGAWPATPKTQLSGYGLFWGLLIGELMALLVLTLFILGTLTRYRAVRRARRTAPRGPSGYAPTDSAPAAPGATGPAATGTPPESAPSLDAPSTNAPRTPFGTDTPPATGVTTPTPTETATGNSPGTLNAASLTGTASGATTDSGTSLGGGAALGASAAAAPGAALGTTPAPGTPLVAGTAPGPSVSPDTPTTAPGTSTPFPGGALAAAAATSLTGAASTPLPGASPEPPLPRLLFGTDRTAATAAALAAVAAAPGPVVVATTDPSLWSASKDARAKLGPVLAYDPAHRLDTPSRLRWSPTAGCEDLATAASRAAALLAPVAPHSPLDAAVADAARTLLRCWLHAAALDGRPFRQLHRWAHATGGAQEPVRVLRTDPKSAPGQAGELESVLTAHPERRDQAKKLADRALSALGSVHIRDACNAQRADALALDSFLDEGGTLYVVGDALEDPRPDPGTMPLLTALLTYVVEHGRRLATRSSTGRLDPPLTLVLDDIAALAPLPALPDLLRTDPPRGLLTLATMRSPEQARARWPHATPPL
ncbi:type VI secretion protein [Streptomyces sp. BBFR2]|uniref:type VI secretion protein n=1 Tax=Streptomyces sp. BBFR2 TaxID=3372854 RepID=UPI0037D9F656